MNFNWRFSLLTCVGRPGRNRTRRTVRVCRARRQGRGLGGSRTLMDEKGVSHSRRSLEVIGSTGERDMPAGD